MSTLYPKNLETVIEEVGTIYYSPGIGGISITSRIITRLEAASVMQVQVGTVVGSQALGTMVSAVITAVGMSVGTVAGQAITGTISATIAPAPNSMRLLIQSQYSAMATLLATMGGGTISTVVGTLPVMVEGVPPATGTVAGSIPIVIKILELGT